MTFTSSMTNLVFSKNMEIALISVLKQRRRKELTYDSFLDRNGEICKIVQRLARTVIWRVSCCWFESTKTYKKSTQQLTKMTVKISTKKSKLHARYWRCTFSWRPTSTFIIFVHDLKHQQLDWVNREWRNWKMNGKKAKLENCCIIKFRI